MIYARLATLPEKERVTCLLILQDLLKTAGISESADAVAAIMNESVPLREYGLHKIEVTYTNAGPNFIKRIIVVEELPQNHVFCDTFYAAQYRRLHEIDESLVGQCQLTQEISYSRY